MLGAIVPLTVASQPTACKPTISDMLVDQLIIFVASRMCYIINCFLTDLVGQQTFLLGYDFL